jgi:hypothetical protein
MLLSTLSNQLDSADLEAERAAYAQAELGAQAALNILRGHGGPKVPAITSSINFYIAINDKTRIDATNPAETPLARLANWLTYRTVKRDTRARSDMSAIPGRVPICRRRYRIPIW